MRECYRSGFCCTKAPCPYGESVSETEPRCKHLVVESEPAGGVVLHACAIKDEIDKDPDSVWSPAFGAGCCSPLFNEQRARNRNWLRGAQGLGTSKET